MGNGHAALDVIWLWSSIKATVNRLGIENHVACVFLTSAACQSQTVAQNQRCRETEESLGWTQSASGEAEEIQDTAVRRSKGSGFDWRTLMGLEEENDSLHTAISA